MKRVDRKIISKHIRKFFENSSNFPNNEWKLPKNKWKTFKDRFIILKDILQIGNKDSYKL